MLRLSDSEDVRILVFSVTELSLHEGQQLSHDMLEQIQSAGRFREIYKKSLVSLPFPHISISVLAIMTFVIVAPIT